MSKRLAKTVMNFKPTRMWIDGKCFNINSPENSPKKKKRTHGKIEQEGTSGNYVDNTDMFKILKENETGKFSMFFELPSSYYIKLKAYPNEFNIESLSEKTKTSISIPKQGDSGKLIISGENEENIKAAFNEILSAIGRIRDRNIALQFIGIPLKSDELINNFETFKSLVLEDTTIKGMDESIFQKSSKLHLTVDVMVLLDDREKKEAIEALNGYKSSKLDPLLEKSGPLKVIVSGIDCMNNNYEKVDVLYANVKFVDETKEADLQELANDISYYFYEKGLLKRYQESVKLHMTLINTKYRKEKDSPKKMWAKRQSFDARSIMEKYKDFNFGICNMDSIHISLISTIGEDGFYKPLSIIKI